MTFVQLETSRQSGAVCELFKFATSGGPTVGGEVVFREAWNYLDIAERDATWVKESSCAAAFDGGATGGFGGTRLHVGAQFGCGLGGGGGYARHVMTLNDVFEIGQQYTMTVIDAERSFVPDFLNYGVSIDFIDAGAGFWIDPDTAAGTVRRTFTATTTDATLKLGLFDLEFGIGGRVLYFGDILITTDSTAPGTLFQNYTSADVPIVYDGDTYNPAVFYRRSPFTVGSGERRDIEVAIPRDHLIAQHCFDGHPRAPITCEIFRIHRGDLTDAAKPVIGQVLRARFEGAVCVLTIGSLKSLLSRKKPSMLTQGHCAHKLYGRYCQLAEEFFTHGGMEVQAVSGRTVRITDGALEIPGSFASLAYFEEGKLTLPNGQMEFIEAEAEVEGTDDLDLTLKAPLAGLEIGSVVTLTAGCKHLPEDCQARGNLGNYGGEPGMPRQDPFSGAGIMGNTGIPGPDE